MTFSPLIKDYVGYGLLSARPALPNTGTGVAPVYYATDTASMYMWDGSGWATVTGPVVASTDFRTLRMLVPNEGGGFDTFATNTVASGTQSGSAATGTTAYPTLPRRGIAPTAGANVLAYYAMGGNNFVLLGSGIGVGGFELNLMFGCGVGVTDGRIFHGLKETLAFSGDPSALTNIIGVGADAGDTNLQVMHNDAAGLATKIDLGASFPAKTTATDVYRLVMEADPNSSSVQIIVTRINTGDTATNTVTTNIPTGILLRPVLMVNSGPTGASSIRADTFNWTIRI